MSLQPVSGITPFRTYNVNFGARNNSNDDISEALPARTLSGLKAVPVAVLIAMSPLNTVEANASSSEMSAPPVEKVEKRPEIVNPTIINSVDIKDEHGRKVYTLNQLSTDDDNSDFEAVELLRYDPAFHGELTQRAIIRHVLTGFYGDSERTVTTVGGYNLDLYDLSNYKNIRRGNFKKSFVSEGTGFLDDNSSAKDKKLIDPILTKWIKSDKNNGALKLHYNAREFKNCVSRNL